MGNCADPQARDGMEGLQPGMMLMKSAHSMHTKYEFQPASEIKLELSFLTALPVKG